MLRRKNPGRDQPDEALVTNLVLEKPSVRTETPDEIVARAVAMRSELAAECEDNNRNGAFSLARQEAFKRAGFYRILSPRR